MSEVSRILSQIEAGEPMAAENLLPLVYDELRRLASAKLAQEKPGQTLDATALVHEAYLRLMTDGSPHNWDGISHFFAAAAEAMRRILIDQARRKASLKRGGDRILQSLSSGDFKYPGEPDPSDASLDLLELNEALEKFEVYDPTKAKLVKLRYFAGLTIPQAADVLGISSTTADRYWAFARAWLHAELGRN